MSMYTPPNEITSNDNIIPQFVADQLLDTHAGSNYRQDNCFAGFSYSTGVHFKALI